MTLVCIAIAVAFLLAIGVWITLFRVFNSRDGERYRKMAMQGPFVPLSADGIAEDERRKAPRAGGNATVPSRAGEMPGDRS